MVHASSYIDIIICLTKLILCESNKVLYQSIEDYK